MTSGRNSPRRKGHGAAHSREGGFSLVELMIASTLGLLILTTMITVFVSASQTRNEVDKSSRQIENGRFAVEMMREDIQLAGFYGDYLPTSSIAWTTPDPCSLKLNRMGFATGYVPVGIYGYASGVTSSTSTTYDYGGATEAGTLGCLSNRKADTGILVIRRVSTKMLRIDNDENGTIDTNVTNEDLTTGVTVASLAGAYYFQASNCSATPIEASYVMAKTTASFVLHGVKPTGTPANCMNGGFSPVRQYMVRIYYIATCNNCSPSDGIPTLKMVELAAGTSACSADPAVDCGLTTTVSIAEGIENLQFEHGIDTTNDGTPDSYSTAPAAADWKNVTAVKIFLLARNTETTADYTDSKTYSLASDGTALTGTPFNDRYKRHVYAATARAVNIGNRR